MDKNLNWGRLHRSYTYSDSAVAIFRLIRNVATGDLLRLRPKQMTPKGHEQIQHIENASVTYANGYLRDKYKYLPVYGRE